MLLGWRPWASRMAGLSAKRDQVFFNIGVGRIVGSVPFESGTVLAIMDPQFNQ